MAPWNGPRWAQRTLALALALLGVPLILGISGLVQDSPIREGEPSPRTVIASQPFKVVDPEATERERREAAESVSPVVVEDEQAAAAIVQQVRDVFARVRAAREPDESGARPSVPQQLETLRERLPMLDETGLRELVGLSDEELAQVEVEAVQVAQQFARQRIREDNLERILREQLNTELAVRSWPGNTADTVVEPVIRDAVRPTVTVDEAATQAARDAAAAEVAEVVRSYTGGQTIVAAGEVVDPVQYAALRERGLDGAEPWEALVRGFALSGVLTLATGLYLRAYRHRLWGSSMRLLLLAVLYALFAITVEAVSVATPTAAGAWLYVIPVGAVAMLATILFDPPIGVLMTIPSTALVAYGVPGDAGVVAFTAIASLVSVPLVSRLSRAGDLRRAAWQSTLAYMALAATFTAIFGTVQQIPTAILAGALNGVLVAVIVNGSLPFLESVFGVLTATSLLSLADRNHPLLMELQQKALGSYNHSIMVSTMAERAARSIGADELLASVAALYHDIGKVRRPYFFVENQFGIENPHDELAPAESAIIIQEHVTDGLEMARTHRLPPEVVEGIASHHGTTLVSYFHRKALAEADDPDSVDESHYRYKGRKPASKEMAILMLADCCEGASRAAALTNRNLSREDLEGIVQGLITERVEDGQLDESSLTFRELKVVEDSFIETLVGVYHPRIAYPPARVKATGDRERGNGQAVRDGGAPRGADGAVEQPAPGPVARTPR